jgi:hypothetical protein
MGVFILTSTIADFVVGYFVINQSEAKKLKLMFFSRGVHRVFSGEA